MGFVARILSCVKVVDLNYVEGAVIVIASNEDDEVNLSRNTRLNQGHVPITGLDSAGLDY